MKADQQAGPRRRGARGRLPAFDADSYRQRNGVERAVNKLLDVIAVNPDGSLDRYLAQINNSAHPEVSDVDAADHRR